MLRRGQIRGTWVLVLALCVPLFGCGGAATDTHDNGNSSGTGGSPAEPNEDDGSIVCGTAATPAVHVTIEGAPISDGQCQIELVFEGPGGGDIVCSASESNCICFAYDGPLVDEETVLRVIGPDDQIHATYSGPYFPAPMEGCASPAYEPIALQYGPGEPTPVVMCGGTDITEVCEPGEGCCSCGCAVVTDSCQLEQVCPPNEGPACGRGTCPEGTVCCGDEDATCAPNIEACPEIGWVEVPALINEEYCTIDSTAFECDDGNFYYQYGTEVGCGLRKVQRVDDQDFYQISYIEIDTEETVFQAEWHGEFGGPCRVPADQEGPAPTCGDGYVVEECGYLD